MLIHPLSTSYTLQYEDWPLLIVQLYYTWNKMKNKIYHTVRIVLKYHTVRIVLKYHTVRIVLKYHTVRIVLKYHTVRIVLKYHTVRIVLKYHTVRIDPKSNRKIPHCHNSSKISHCQNSSKIQQKIVERGKIDTSNTQTFLAWYQGTSIKVDVVILVLWAHSDHRFLNSEIF
jgi:hypothetical protein